MLQGVQVDTDYVYCTFEDFNGLTFIHCDIKTEWTRDIREKIKQDWDRITESVDEVNACISVDNTKLKKFAKLYGFEYAQTLESRNSDTYEIYTWRK